MKTITLSFLLAILLLAMLFIYQFQKFHDGKLHVFFCNVGQGDAILTRTPNQKYILVDGGPDKSVLDCLSAHMPFWQRKIDLVILTHPHSDHISGLYYVLQRYTVNAFATEDLKNDTAGFKELVRMIAEKKIPEHFVFTGDRWHIGDVTITIEGPTVDYLKQTSPGGLIGERQEFASVITNISYGSFDALLTGDSQVSGLTQAAAYLGTSVAVLQTPHHGSATGLDENVLSLLQPKLAVISVGLHNRYGHPTTRALNFLRDGGTKIFRTDKDGTVEVVSDGSAWEIIQ